jgi:hypothetical protein
MDPQHIKSHDRQGVVTLKEIAMEKTSYRVYYMKPESFRMFILGGERPIRSDLDQTHAFLRHVEDVEQLGKAGLEEVFRRMQGEFWSPNGEARNLILSKGLAHTSMSVGDVIEDANGTFWAVAPVGFVEI